MPRFNLNDYETVEERIKRFYAMAPDGRITTKLVYDFAGDGPKRWVVKAFVYLTAGDQANKLPKATGYAEETDGTGGANNGSALENAETSAIGRALANLAMSGNKRASREEMSKINRLAETDWLAQADRVTDVGGLRWIYSQAKAAGAPADVLERLAERAKELNPDGENSGADGGVSPGRATGAKK